jgi:hypothetical protein
VLRYSQHIGGVYSYGMRTVGHESHGHALVQRCLTFHNVGENASKGIGAVPKASRDRAAAW